MSQDLMPVDARERSLIWALREMPPGRLHGELLQLLEDLMKFAQDLHCAPMQADGVPCPSAHTACDDCGPVLERLDRIRAAVRSA